MNERIKKIRKEVLGLTLEEFGKRLGVTKTAISKIENNVINVTEQMLLSICREFNVREDWLRTGNGSMFVEMSKDEEIAKFIGTMQMDESDTFKKSFISMLAKLDEDEWVLLEKMAKKLAEEAKRKKPDQ